MSGSLTIPNDIGSQSGPRVPASLFDDNWQAVETYINAREVGFDTVAHRPAAGVPGRWYYATDQSTLYVDNGTAWIVIAGTGSSGASGPLPGSIKQESLYNSGNLDRFTLVADRIVVSSSTGASSHSITSVSVSVDLTVTGLGGRDQGAALSGNSWAHLYWIYNSATAALSSLVSASAWPTATPTLPAGYGEFAYAGAVRLDGAGQFAPMAIRGRRTLWLTPQSVLAAGAASSATAISLGGAVPVNATWAWGYASMQSTAPPAGAETVYGELLFDTAGTPTTAAVAQLSYAITATQTGSAAGAFELHPRSQQMYYRIVDAGGGAADGTNQMTVSITSFENPNGG